MSFVELDATHFSDLLAARYNNGPKYLDTVAGGTAIVTALARRRPVETHRRVQRRTT